MFMLSLHMQKIEYKKHVHVPRHCCKYLYYTQKVELELII